MPHCCEYPRWRLRILSRKPIRIATPPAISGTVAADGDALDEAAERLGKQAIRSSQRRGV
jgi:hypothetical protein